MQRKERAHTGSSRPLLVARRVLQGGRMPHMENRVFLEEALEVSFCRALSRVVCWSTVMPVKTRPLW